MPHPKSLTPVSCKHCKNDFYPRLDNLRSGRGIFCSKSCRCSFNNPKTIKNCIHCGAEFQVRLKVQRFCSRGCSVRHKHPSWIEDRSVAEARLKLFRFCRKQVSRCLNSKTNKTLILVGYTTDELRAHLERQWKDGMTWSNYGPRKNNWNIDHIRPVSTFPLDTGVEIINALSNLRPLWALENYRKENLKKWNNALHQEKTF